MATSNRERIDDGLAILAAGLLPFVDAVMGAAAPAGQDWVRLLQDRDNARQGTKHEYARDDPRFLLKVLTDGRQAFRGKLSRAEQGFASELMAVGNLWAHGDKFDARSTYRALDTMELLLTAVGATDEAEQIRKLARDTRQAEFNAETRQAIQSVGGIAGSGLRPWREVIVPHKDVMHGNLRGAEFAADLYYVSIGEGSREYTDPVEFFRRTYLTEGLKDLLQRAARRVGGDSNASPVVNLQTNFGGGKTHSMLALWHLLSGSELSRYPDELQKLLAGHDIAKLGRSARRVALVGNHIAAGKGSVKARGTPYETHVKTLWGELAWQLGAARGGDAEARAAYEIVADADVTRSNPGAALGELIAVCAPCLILIDEWVAYARQLYGRDDLDAGSFATQFTFAQTLTEAVKAVPGAMLVVSVPASSDKPSDEEAERGATDLEVGGQNGREALAQLQQVIRRVADQWRPATAEESFAIVRRRLFEEPGADAQAEIAAVARVFTEFYARHRGEFPNGVSELAYEERIKAAYPIHPELFDRLYQDWSTLERFQRTRGVLRLMSAVIHSLWRSTDPAPLIMPGGVPLDADDVLTEISQYLEDNFKPVIDADVDGADPTPAKIDVSRPTLGQRRITRRIARTIFLGSAATLRAAHKGIEQPFIWLGVATPGDQVGNFGSALHMLSEQATYLYNDGARYWYDVAPTVARMAREHADRLRERPDLVHDEILDRLRRDEQRARGMFATVQIGPETSAEIPDDPAVRLVILHPQFRHARGEDGSEARVFARGALLGRGNAPRMNRNMIVFLAPDAKRYEELDAAVREYLAWQNIAVNDERMEELGLSAQQRTQARKSLAEANDKVRLRIPATYQWVLVPVQPEGQQVSIDELRTDTARERLAERAGDKLRNADMLRDVHGARNIRLNLDQLLSSVWEQGHVGVGKLWEYYCEYVYLPRLAERSVLNRGITDVFGVVDWEFEGFAVAAGFDAAIGKYELLAIPGEDPPPQITDSTLLVRPERAIAQRDQERAARDAARAAAGDDTSGSTAVGGSASDDTSGSRPQPGNALGGTAVAPKNTRFYGVAKINSDLYVKELTKLTQEIIQHLAADDAHLEICVEITAQKRDGYPDEKVRIVTENARTLKLDPYGFEDR